MSTLNQAQLIGRLGKDPEVRVTNSGLKVCNFSVATSDGGKTEWHRIIVFDKAAAACGTYLKKGSMVFIQGKIQTKKFQNKQGFDQYQTEIVAHNVQFLPSSKKEDDSQAVNPPPPEPVSKNLMDDFGDIPF